MNDRQEALLRIARRAHDYAEGRWYESKRADEQEPSALSAMASHDGVGEIASERAAKPSPASKARAALQSPSRGLSGVPSGAPLHAPTDPSRAPADSSLAPPSYQEQTAASFEERRRALKALAERVMACQKCPLHQKRTQAVPGEGVLDPDVLVIGEAPGANEDRYGKPFVGRAGQYLDKWLQAINISRTTNAYIANIIKCRPPNNRDPAPAEITQCMPYLKEQIALIRPKIILVAGRIAAHHLFDIRDSLAMMRRSVRTFHDIRTIITYHPSAVLRNPSLRRPVWEDLQKMQKLITEE